MLTNAMVKLKDSLSCSTYNGAQHTHIQINETGAEAKLKKVTLNAPPWRLA
jgi:ferredoxin-like protein FixX